MRSWLSSRLRLFTLWTIFGSFCRSYSWSLSGEQGLPWAILWEGAVYDLLAFGILLVLMECGTFFVKRSSRLLRFFGYTFYLLVLSLVLLTWGDALFLSWARFHLSWDCLEFVGSMTSLWLSIDDMLSLRTVSRERIIIFASVMIGFFLVLWAFLARKVDSRITWVSGFYVLGALVFSLWSVPQQHGHFRQELRQNFVLHFVNNSLEQVWQNSPKDMTIMDPRTLRAALKVPSRERVFFSLEYPVAQFFTAAQQPFRPDVEVPDMQQQRPNIVMLFLESFRAADIGTKDHLTPRFDELSAQGWSWTNFYANSMQTSRGALSALSSMYSPLGVAIAHREPNFPLRGLAEVLRDHGYRTEYYHNGPLTYANKKDFFTNLGYEKIWGMYDFADFADQRVGWGFPDHLLLEWLGKRLMQAQDEQPVLLNAFTVTTHHPWKVPDARFELFDPKGGQYNGYRNSMHYTDDSLGRFFDSLSEEVKNKTVFIITADTGQPMGEHDDNYALLHSLYEENLRVPFLIYAPGYIKTPHRFPAVASQVDILPTLLHFLRQDARIHGVGRSLLAKQDTAPFAYFSNPYQGKWIGLREGPWKYFYHLREDKHYLFNLDDDPGELRNVASEQPQVVSVLHSRVSEMNNATQNLIQQRRLWSD